jgi:ADP-ribose pyrophosphatase
MGIIDMLLNDYKLHKKSRAQKHTSYPMRFMVPDDKVSWQTEFTEYKPVPFTAPIVLDINTPWADPDDISKITHPIISYEGNVKLSEHGLPLNPFGRTGISGRGVLGKWGANFAVDGLISTVNPLLKIFQVLTITRVDTGETAFPGGMVDPGEDAITTRNRELEEELAVNKEDLINALYEKVVSRGYVDDPRNTDNAWIETTVIHSHISFEKAMQMNLSAGDDAKGYQWLDVTKDSIQNFYANHGLSLLLAIKELLNQCNVLIDRSLLVSFMKIFEE